MLKLITAISTIGLSAVVCSPAMAQAQTAAPAAGQQQRAGPNPNEIVCQKQEVIGSRLAVKRICKTRAEWADARMQDRKAIEKIQTERGMPGN